MQFLEDQSLCGSATWQNLVTYEGSLTKTGCEVTVPTVETCWCAADGGCRSEWSDLVYLTTLSVSHSTLGDSNGFEVSAVCAVWSPELVSVVHESCTGVVSAAEGI